MCPCEDLQPVENIGSTVLAKAAKADIDFKFPVETVIGSAVGVFFNVLLKVAAENDFGNSPLGQKTTLAMTQAAAGLSTMLFAKSEIATTAGLTVLTGALEPALQAIGIGDGQRSIEGIGSAKAARKRNKLKTKFFKMVVKTA